MNIETATRQELKDYMEYLLGELSKYLTPEEVRYSGMSWKDYKDMREYLLGRLVAVNTRLLRI